MLNSDLLRVVKIRGLKRIRMQTKIRLRSNKTWIAGVKSEGFDAPNLG